MQKTDTLYTAYVEVLKEELLPAMGCTEPIAIAYAAAAARRILNELPCEVCVTASGNIIKNVKSVFVPNTGGLRGIPAAAAAGIIAGHDELLLEVISKATEAEQAEIKAYMEHTPITVKLSDSPYIFDIDITVKSEHHTANVRIVGHHTNIVHTEKDGEILLDTCADTPAESTDSGICDRSSFSVKTILEFIECAELCDIETPVKRQIDYNTRIAKEGLSGSWGANIGKVLLETYGDDVKIRARAMAAAGSDARMNGCSLPVVIVSGSGNQGITATLPVIAAVLSLKADEEMLYRSLALSCLITIHVKQFIGKLSPLCGCGMGSSIGVGCALTYLQGGGLSQIRSAINNMIADVSGIICDGAKAGCALKIATVISSAYQCSLLALRDLGAGELDGIVRADVENSIRNLGELGNRGMADTDRVILDMMVCR